jgi:hypothetical protein
MTSSSYYKKKKEGRDTAYIVSGYPGSPDFITWEFLNSKKIFQYLDKFLPPKCSLPIGFLPFCVICQTRYVHHCCLDCVPLYSISGGKLRSCTVKLQVFKLPYKVAFIRNVTQVHCPNNQRRKRKR